MNKPPIALYAVGCKSWHDTLKKTFKKNNGMTWLQYDVDIKSLFEAKGGFNDVLKKYGYFYVYGHVTTTDYKFNNFEPKEVSKGEYCFKVNSHSEVENDIRSDPYSVGGHVSVIYKIINEPEPKISDYFDKQPPPPEAPPFKAYDIKQGHCDELSFRDCDRIRCENRRHCEYRQNHSFFKYGYQTWLPVGDIIDIEPIHFDQFKVYDRYYKNGDKEEIKNHHLHFKNIFPVLIHGEHKNFYESY